MSTSSPICQFQSSWQKANLQQDSALTEINILSKSKKYG